MSDIVGIVLGTETKSSEALEFWVGVREDSYLQLDDVVYVETGLPGSGERITFYGTVQYIRRFFEGLSFDSDSMKAVEGRLPVNLTYAAHISVTRVVPSIFIAPQPGDSVFRAKGKELREGLFIDRMEEKLPAGLLRTGDPYFLNYAFLSGDRGAHASISGISGIATKTTYSMFLVYSLFHSGVLKGEASNTKCIVFNVKSEDLLFIDHPNTKLELSEEESYRALGLPVRAFESVNFYAPSRPGSDSLLPATERRRTGITAYMWTLRQIARERLFSFLFAEGGDELSTLLQYIRVVESVLANAVKDGKSDAEPLLSPSNESVSDLFELYEDILNHSEAWFKTIPFHAGSVNAFLRRLQNAAYQTRGLIRKPPADRKAPAYKIDWQAKQITVIDIHTLPAAAKMFVVGAVLKTIFRDKEEQGTARPHVFVMLDELNKYAGRDSWSPIKDVLLDISERGRSLGVFLIGAQQTASEVEHRVYANSAIRVVGRMDTAEVEGKEYSWLGPVFKKRAKILTSGSMILHQPEVPTPILVHFPFPAWATRPEEAGEAEESAAEDPFDF